MSTKLQTPTKVPSMPKLSLTPVQSHLLQRKCACGGTPGVDGECAECRVKRLSLQRSADNPSTPSIVPPIVHDVLGSPGQPLDAGTRVFMEPRFGHDFSNVRVHSNARAAESARSVNAHAYTVGRDVVFGMGQYAPGTAAGRKLMAHELTHVVQQEKVEDRGSIQSKLTMGAADDIYEREADILATRMTGDNRIDTARVNEQTSISRLQRKSDASKELAEEHLDCKVPTSSPAVSSFTELSFHISDAELSSNRERKDKVESESEKKIADFAKDWQRNHPKDEIRVDGYASKDGPERFNLLLSCRRALAVKKELMEKHGIPEGTITTFAHGATTEFSKTSLSKNRHAVISTIPKASPSSITRECPKGAKTVTVDLVSLRGSSRNSVADLAFANNIFKPCCVKFVMRTGLTASTALSDRWLGGDTDIQKAECGSVTDEELNTYRGATSQFGLSSRFRVFYVASSTPGERGYSVPPFCATGTRVAIQYMSVVTNSAASRTLAHEFGHTLLDVAGSHSDDTNNLMHTTNGATGEQLTPEQCTTIFNNA